MTHPSKTDGVRCALASIGGHIRLGDYAARECHETALDHLLSDLREQRSGGESL